MACQTNATFQKHLLDSDQVQTTPVVCPKGKTPQSVKAAHQPPLRGLGDVVAKVAQPIAKAIDKVAGTNVQGCGGCKARQAKLNALVPFKPAS